jgi:dTMP kinase
MIKNAYQGKFIVFEGLDGSGQSTEAELLKNFLSEKGIDVILTKEPTMDSDAGKKIRDVLDKKEKAEPDELQSLFASDRREHLNKLIIPSLKQGKWIVSDRYCFSSFAYGTSDKVELDWIIRINDDFVLPDLTIILKVRPGICIERIEKRGSKKTLFEKQEKLAEVWNIYEVLPERFGNCVIIDGEKSIEEVFKEVKKIVNNRFNSK